jgi:hypothetical protein
MGVRRDRSVYDSHMGRDQLCFNKNGPYRKGVFGRKIEMICGGGACSRSIYSSQQRKKTKGTPAHAQQEGADVLCRRRAQSTCFGCRYDCVSADTRRRPTTSMASRTRCMSWTHGIYHSTTLPQFVAPLASLAPSHIDVGKWSTKS